MRMAQGARRYGLLHACLLCACLPALPARAADASSGSGPSPATLDLQTQAGLPSYPGANGAQSAVNTGPLRNYGREVGESWLKDTLGVDLESLQIVWDPETESFVTAGDLAQRSPAPGSAASRGQGAGPGQGTGSGGVGGFRGISLRLTQTEDFMRLTEGMRDVPFGLELRGSVPLVDSLAAMDARLKVPLSPNDEWRAEASLPVELMGMTSSAWWRSLGLGRSLAIRSDISSRLGLNQLEAGMGTAWNPGLIGVWNLDYAWYVRYGQGSDETVQWLKLSKGF
jgi:hypothetical protein